MVVADPEATLLTACENGYGKRTPFGVGTLTDEETDEDAASAARYRTQRRGGKGLRDIKTTRRNGRVIGIARVSDDDELIMMTARGKIQRIAVREISTIGRNTQGVRIMKLDEEDVLAAIVRVPQDEGGDEELANPAGSGAAGAQEGPPQFPAPPGEKVAHDAITSQESDESEGEGAEEPREVSSAEDPESDFDIDRQDE
jgi:DNA gyrase subunit A